MTETSSSPTWDEYLRRATEHLSEVRRTAALGESPPPAPGRPQGQIPDDRRGQARHLALGYDQLAVEVTTRMAVIEQRRPSPVRRSPHQEQPLARYIDAPI